jgi:hypothetical protein
VGCAQEVTDRRVPPGGTVAAEQGGGTAGGGLARRVWRWAEQRALGPGSIFFFLFFSISCFPF